MPLVSLAQFGDFEAAQKIPGFNNESIDELVKQPDPAISFVGAIVTLVTAAIVAISLIAIMVAGYIYMTAGGDSSRVEKAKTIIVSAILGIVLALTAVLILRTINPALVPTSDPF